MNKNVRFLTHGALLAALYVALTYLQNTVIMWIMNFIPQILVSLLLAAWLTNNKVKIKGQIYELVPIYDLKNSIAFEYDGDDTFLNCEVEFIL